MNINDKVLTETVPPARSDGLTAAERAELDAAWPDTLQSPPTQALDLKIGDRTYYVTLNELADTLLNLLPALTDADLTRLHDLGAVAQGELFARINTRRQTENNGPARVQFGDPALIRQVRKKNARK